MVCPKCGYENPDDSVFCVNCGCNIEEAKAELVICPNCGAVLPDGSKFCNHCGSEIKQQESNKEEISLSDQVFHHEKITHNNWVSGEIETLEQYKAVVEKVKNHNNLFDMHTNEILHQMPSRIDTYLRALNAIRHLDRNIDNVELESITGKRYRAYKSCDLVFNAAIKANVKFGHLPFKLKDYIPPKTYSYLLKSPSYEDESSEKVKPDYNEELRNERKYADNLAFLKCGEHALAFNEVILVSEAENAAKEYINTIISQQPYETLEAARMNTESYKKRVTYLFEKYIQ